MPRFDGTGPLGRYPMTGGGRGYCILPLQKTADIPEPGTKLNTFSCNPRLGLQRRRGCGNQGRSFLQEKSTS